ncbi:MAG: hypothetical protein PVH65_08080 [Chloroflexota bacterium]|jgi:ABC-type thiamin/hydroxymethylpyrimidine transport system permease subunit
MRFSTRELVTLTVFGTLWGAVEISLGSLLHLVNMPMSGPLLAAVGLAIALIGRLFVPRRGSTLYIGVVATILKLFSIGSVVVGPMIGIMMEVIIAEIVLTAFGRPRRLSFVLAGALAILWTLAQPFFTGILLFGRDIFVIWLDLLDQGSRLFGIDSSAAIWILLALSTAHAALGGLSGWLAWGAGRLLRARLAGASLLPSG